MRDMLTVSDIHTYYGDSYVIQGVSLGVERGRITVLMGRNGAGKTTVIRSIAGLTPPRRGSIRFGEVELTRLPAHEIARRGIGLVPQGRRIFASLSVGEHLAIAASRRRETSWTLERIFTIFPRLRERINQRAAHLSGGEQSMLAIARALRTEPECLLMDEPTEGLAPLFMDIVLDVIRELRASGELGILIVVQELPIALAIADHICVLDKGRTVFEGSPQELEKQPEVQARYIGVGV
ncbi:MAG TPA: ABC transporter ATP-binding protein [Stellaceae bacterium]|nr:ABC transporter ATP-binding protein [Stellaceae bacterium]